MTRKVPAGKLDIIGNLDLRPENAVGNFIESIQQEKFFIKPPSWDVAGDSIELLSIQNEREFQKMLKLQEEMLKNAKKQRVINAHRIEELYKIQRDLRDRFVSVNAFIQDCESKRTEAEKKVQYEIRTQEKLKIDIEKYSRDIEELKEFRSVLQDTVKDFEPYEKVIQEVVENSDILNSVKDCMDRCDALMLAQVEITELEQEKLKQIEEMRRNMMKTANEAALTVLGLNNELADLERSYNNAKAETIKWEKIIANTKDHIAGNELVRDGILDAIQTMYKLLCRRQGLDVKIKRENVEEQLDFIKGEIEILQNVVKICKKPTKK